MKYPQITQNTKKIYPIQSLNVEGKTWIRQIFVSLLLRLEAFLHTINR